MVDQNLFCHLTEMKLYWKWSSSLGETDYVDRSNRSFGLLNLRPPDSGGFFMKKDSTAMFARDSPRKTRSDL